MVDLCAWIYAHGFMHTGFCGDVGSVETGLLQGPDMVSLFLGELLVTHACSFGWEVSNTDLTAAYPLLTKLHLPLESTSANGNQSSEYKIDFGTIKVRHPFFFRYMFFQWFGQSHVVIAP
jgi:hypothetical protein